MSFYLRKWDVWITEVEMPLRVRAFCKRLNEDDCIVINSDLSDEKKLEVLQHELQHIKQNDLDSEFSAALIEHRVRNKSFMEKLKQSIY